MALYVTIYVTIMYVAMYYICDSVWRYMAARFESNKKKLYIGFIGEREAAEYIATSNIRSFDIFFFSGKSPHDGKRKNLIQYHIALPVPKPACLQDSHPRMATMMRLEKFECIWVRGCLSSFIVEI